MVVVVVVVATTGVSAFLHNHHHLRMLNSATLTKEPLLGEVMPLPFTGDAASKETTRSSANTRTSSTTVQLFMLPLSSIANLYSYASSNYYLATQAATMSMFSGMGDVLAQTLERHQAAKVNSVTSSATTISRIPHDWSRTRRFFLKGIGCGLIWTALYQIAESWSHALTNSMIDSFKATLTPQSLYRWKAIVYTLVSIALEQFVASPIIFGLWDIPLLSYLHGTPVAKLPGVVRKKLLPLLIANAKLWTFVNILIYNVPLQFRVAALSCADLIWQTILSTSLASPAAVATGDHSSPDQELDEEMAHPLVVPAVA